MNLPVAAAFILRLQRILFYNVSWIGLFSLCTAFSISWLWSFHSEPLRVSCYKRRKQQQKSPSKSKALSFIFQEALVRVCKCLAGWKMKNRAQIWHKQLSVTGVNDYRKWKWWKLNDKVICFSCKLVSKRLCSRIFIPPGLKLSLKALRTTFGREQSR